MLQVIIILHYFLPTVPVCAATKWQPKPPATIPISPSKARRLYERPGRQPEEGSACFITLCVNFAFMTENFSCRETGRILQREQRKHPDYDLPGNCGDASLVPGRIKRYNNTVPWLRPLLQGGTGCEKRRRSNFFPLQPAIESGIRAGFSQQGWRRFSCQVH